jgi:hypothetical protein
MAGHDINYIALSGVLSVSWKEIENVFSESLTISSIYNRSWDQPMDLLDPLPTF